MEKPKNETDNKKGKKPKKGKNKQKWKTVAADDTSGDLGKVNYFGSVNKYTKQTHLNKLFHPRWVVLRGMRLYWYREAKDKESKDTILLQSTPLKYVNKSKSRCFELTSTSRKEMLFKDDNNEFKLVLQKLICFRMYLG